MLFDWVPQDVWSAGKACFQDDENKLPTSHCDLITINIALKSKYYIDED